MNDLKAFNEAMEYIERHLDDIIDYDKLGIISNCPTALFSRIFSILSGISLGEYIRIRKLSKAATELYLSNEKVIDIALKYGYDSVDAFSAAFKRYHKKTPSQVKKGEKFQILMPLKFSLKIEGKRKMIEIGRASCRERV